MGKKKENEEKKEARDRFKATLRTLREKKLLTEASFVRLMGVSSAYVQNFTANMSPGNQYKIEKIFPFINLEYIQTGIGEMFTKEPTKKDIAMSREVAKEVKIELANSKNRFENSMNQVGGDMIVGKESEVVAVLKARITSLEQERDYLRQQCNMLMEILSGRKND